VKVPKIEKGGSHEKWGGKSSEEGAVSVRKTEMFPEPKSGQRGRQKAEELRILSSLSRGF